MRAGSKDGCCHPLSGPACVVPKTRPVFPSMEFMKTTTPSLLKTGLLQATLFVGLGLSQGLAQTVTFVNTPTVVSNTYTGPITLQIGGLTNGETVVVQSFLDVNTNGVIDASDWLMQQFKLTDGLASLIGGIVNSNVPGDTTPTNGAITAQLAFGNGNPIQGFAGKFLVKLSSPGGHFTPITNSFTVTNLPYAQGFTGHVVCSGTNVPYALVMLFPGELYKSSVQCGVVADGTGSYTIKAPPGTYSLAAIKTNYVQSAPTAPVVTLGSTTITTNITLLAATTGLSGQVVDSANSSRGLPGILVSAKSDSNAVAVSFTDTNGNFSFGVNSGQWTVDADDASMIAHGYLKLQNDPTVSAGATGITLTEVKATALFYGSVKDSQGNPMKGIDLYANDSNNQYELDAYTDQNGNYCAAVLGGLSNNPWNFQVSQDGGPANYIFSLPPFSGNNGINLTDGQAVQCNFVGLAATNHISGYLTNAVTGLGIANVGMPAWATVNGLQFMAYGRTDASGYYSEIVANGVWNMNVNCGDCSDCLGGQYLCPNSQTITIANNSTNINFAALLPTSQINGYVKNLSNMPIPNVSVYAYMPTNSGGPGPGATTDVNGYYSFYVANGSWHVGVNCCGNNALNPLGYLCVGEQPTTVVNSTNTVNFSIASAPYQITGHLRDGSGNPIANVGVNGGGSSFNACATTATDGSYTLHVSSGDWWVSFDCGALGSLGYLCPGGQSVTVSSANVVADFAADQAPYTISGWVRNTGGLPFTNLNVQASATLGTNTYWLNTYTDTDGNYSIPVANGQWWVALDCSGLGSGYLCPNEVDLVIAGASVATNFSVQSCGALQIVTTSPLPAGQVGVPYDINLQASSCYPNFWWSVSGGSLPQGLQLDSSGELYGTPQANGTFSFTLQVTDGNSQATNRAVSLTISPAPSDVLSYSVTRLQAFWQSDATHLVPDTTHGPFVATLSLIQADFDKVPIAEVYLPGGAVRGFPRGSSALELQVRETFLSQAALDAVYPIGAFTFALATRDNGFQFPVLTMPAVAYPTAPRISNFAAAQAIDPANPFTVQWISPPDATTNDSIWAFIQDSNGNTVISTPYPATNQSGCLRGTATSVLVPAHTLQLGGTYTGVIVFFRVTSVNLSDCPGATGLTLVGVDTAFPMVAPSAALPVLSQPTRLSDTQFGFVLSGAASQSYTVLASTNPALPLTSWSTVLTTNLSGSSAVLQDNQATNRQRYYRVKAGL
jgi:hypothetical protein